MDLFRGVVKNKELFEILRRVDTYADAIQCDGNWLQIHGRPESVFLVQNDQRLGFVLLNTRCLENAWTRRFALRDGLLETVEDHLEPQKLAQWQEWLTNNRQKLMHYNCLLHQPWPGLGLIGIWTGMKTNLLRSSYRSCRIWKCQFIYCAGSLNLPYPVLFALAMNQRDRELLIWIHRAKECGFVWQSLNQSLNVLVKGKQRISFQRDHLDQVVIDIGKPLSRWISKGQASCIACPIDSLSTLDVRGLRQAMLDIEG